MFLPETARGLVRDFIYQTMTTLTPAEKQGQFIVSMQAMAWALPLARTRNTTRDERRYL